MNSTGAALLAFLRDGMAMSANYQPVLLSELIKENGPVSRRDMAQAIVLADASALLRADQVVMRWPRRTLERHRLIIFDRSTQCFRLDVEFSNDSQRQDALALCETKIAEWASPSFVRKSARRFAAIRKAQGRCQACGITATALGPGQALDVDHIVPWVQRRATSNKVKLPGSDEWIDANDPASLQVLCPACNRGKRDTDTFDFRASPRRLAEAIAAIQDLARQNGQEAELGV